MCVWWRWREMELCIHRYPSVIWTWTKFYVIFQEPLIESISKWVCFSSEIIQWTYERVQTTVAAAVVFICSLVIRFTKQTKTSHSIRFVLIQLNYFNYNDFISHEICVQKQIDLTCVFCLFVCLFFSAHLSVAIDFNLKANIDDECFHFLNGNLYIEFWLKIIWDASRIDLCVFLVSLTLWLSDVVIAFVVFVHRKIIPHNWNVEFH